MVLIWSGHVGVPPVRRGIRVIRIPPEEFDHGGTRQLALEICASQFLVFVSDDATPLASQWLEQFIVELSEPNVGAVFGRQCPREDAPRMDRVFRQARYPQTSTNITLDGRGRMSLVAPVSNANGAYRTDALRSVGGFPARCCFAEDRDVVRRLLMAGWKVRYSASAAVYHSHYHTWRDVLSRGEAAAGDTNFYLDARELGSWMQFAWRSLRSASPKDVLAVGVGVGLRLVGVLRAKMASIRSWIG